MTLTKTQLSAMTRLFSSAVFKELASKGYSSLFLRLLNQAKLTHAFDSFATVGDAFDAAFATLRISGYRDEYIYRSALTHKILLGKHSLRTASMLSEFRAGTSKADLVILNGTATVYEIKSERDSLIRLTTQVANYKRVFASVNVICSENHVDGVTAAIPDDVGIMCLSNRYQISIVREATDQPNQICPITMFESLRSTEVAAILKSMNIVVPDVPNTQRRILMRSLFAELPPAMLHKQMVHTLKRTRDLAPLNSLVDKLPESLHAAALCTQIRRTDYGRLINAVATPLRTAVAWT